jgi:hypothetical protein
MERSPARPDISSEKEDPSMSNKFARINSTKMCKVQEKGIKPWICPKCQMVLAIRRCEFCKVEYDPEYAVPKK